MTFGEKLQKLRTQRSLSQDALAEALDVSRQAVSRWERDETLPETEKVIRLSRYFQVTTDYLLLEEIPSPRQQPALIRLHAWWADRGWLLGVGLAVLGVLWLLRLLTGGWTYMRMLTEGHLSWFQAAAQYLFACLERIAAAGGLAAAGVLTAALGRRRQGALRWHHFGWTAVLWSTADLMIQVLVSLWLFSLLERGTVALYELWLGEWAARCSLPWARRRWGWQWPFWGRSWTHLGRRRPQLLRTPSESWLSAPVSAGAEFFVRKG